MRRFATFLFFIVAISWLPGQDAPQFIPEIITHSGSPLLLELSIPDPKGQLSSVAVETGISSTSYEIQPLADRDVVQLTVSPFLVPGSYDLRVLMEADLDGETLQIQSQVQIGFVDYVFGRDNYRFGNNADYESVIGTYGEILESWLDDRFGEISDAELVPLVHYMYGFFGKRSGRCYAFAGSEVRFWHWPDLLPSYFDETYDFRAGGSATQREMNYLQLDMAFNHFLTGQYDPIQAVADDPLHGRREAILDEVGEIVSRIDAGVPVAVGFMGPELHHAMVVYGYIRSPESVVIDLLVANNWKSEQDLNLRSKNAEAIRVFLEPTEDQPMFEWRYVDGTRNREIDRLFIVEVEREYQHEREHLDRLTAARLGKLARDNLAVLVVEDAAGAWLTNGDTSTGYIGRRTLEEIDDVVFDKVNETFLFEYPADTGLWLELDDNVGARILYYNPGNEPGTETAWVEETTEPDEGTTIRRRVSLETSAPLWEVVSEPED